MTEIEDPKPKTKTAPRFKRGCLRDCLNYLAKHPNKPITVEELAEKTGWVRNQIMQALSRSSWREGTKTTNPLVLHVEKLQTGMWRFVEKPLPTPDKYGEPEQPSLDKLTVEVIKQRPTYLLVEDIDDGKIYKMTLVD